MIEPALQLWLLIDDGTDTALGTQLDDLRRFVLEQPSTTRLGIGYLRNGTVQVQQKPTADHALAAKAIRLPLGQPGISASPYLALTDLIQKWPRADQVREVLMITSGVDPDYGPGPSNPYLDRAIEAAQRDGRGCSFHLFQQCRTFWPQPLADQLGTKLPFATCRRNGR